MDVCLRRRTSCPPPPRTPPPRPNPLLVGPLTPQDSALSEPALSPPQLLIADATPLQGSVLSPRDTPPEAPLGLDETAGGGQAGEQGLGRGYRVGTWLVLNERHAPLCVVPPLAPWRALVFEVLDSTGLLWFMSGVAFANLLVLVLDTPVVRDRPGVSVVVVVSDIVLQCIFTVELGAKVVTLGLARHRYSFLRYPWHWLELLIVMVGFVVLAPVDSLVKRLLRLVRAARLVRLLFRLRLFRNILLALWRSVPKMRDALVLMVFVVFGMAVLGLQLFAETFQQRCFVPVARGNATPLVLDPAVGSLCSLNPNSGHSCDVGVCTHDLDQYHSRYLNFDSIFHALFVTIKMVTMDNWPSDVRLMQEANGISYFLFAAVLIVFGSYFAVNLTLAILSTAYETVTERQSVREEEQREAVMHESFLQSTVQEARPATPQDDGGEIPDADVAGSAVRSAANSPPPKGSRFSFVVRARRWLWFNVVSETWFLRLSLGVTLVNVAALACDHHGINAHFETVLDIVNVVCTVYFLLELLLKLFVMLGIFFTDTLNLLDLALCVVSLPELYFSWGNGGSAFSVFRAFRLVRALRVVNVSGTARQLLFTVMDAATSSVYLFLVLLLFVFISGVFAVLVFPEAVPDGRPNFRNLPEACLGMFIVLTGDNWVDVAVSVMEGSHWTAAFFFVPYFVVGNYVLLNFVVVILMFSFSWAARQIAEESEEEVDLRQHIADHRPSDAGSVSVTAELHRSLSFVVIDADAEAILRRRSRTRSVAHSLMDAQEFIRGASPDGPGEPPAGDARLGGTLTIGRRRSMTVGPQLSARTPTPPPAAEPVVSDTDTHAAASTCRVTRPVTELSIRDFQPFSLVRWLAAVLGLPYGPEVWVRVEGRSFTLFAPSNPLRHGCVVLTSHPFFELTLMAVIAVSCVALAFDNERQRENSGVQAFVLSNLILTVVFFTIDLAMRCVAWGVWQGEHAYLRDPWHWVDVGILAVSVVGIALPSPFRAVLSLRVFRLGARWPSIRIMATSLIRALPKVLNVVAIAVFVFVIFGVLGVQLFKGRFVTCTDPAVRRQAECVGTFMANVTAYNATTMALETTAVERTRRWSHAFTNFNHIGEAFLSLSVLFYGDGWSQLLYYGMDSVSTDEAMETNARWYMAAFFIVFVFVGNFFVNNLFVGSLVDSFAAEHARIRGRVQEDGQPLLSPAQERWLREYRSALGPRLPRVVPPPQNPVRRLCCWIYFDSQADRTLPRPAFEWAITAAIVINALFMATQYAYQPDSWTKAHDYVGIAFTAVYLLEFLVKVGALLPVAYFWSPWNCFDALVLVAGALGIVFNGPGTNALRVARVARCLRLVRRWKGLHRMFQSIVVALPQLLNASVVLTMLLFVFGSLGTALFENLHVDNEDGFVLSQFYHFQHLVWAMMLLLQIGTGEQWLDTLEAAMMREDSSRCSEAAGDCGTWMAIPFFLVFMLVVHGVAMNVFIFIIVDSYMELDLMSGQHSQLLAHRLERFRQRWAKADRDRGLTLHWSTVLLLLREMHYHEAEEDAAFLDGAGVLERLLEDGSDDGSGDDWLDDNVAPSGDLSQSDDDAPTPSPEQRLQSRIARMKDTSVKMALHKAFGFNGGDGNDPQAAEMDPAAAADTPSAAALWLRVLNHHEDARVMSAADDGNDFFQRRLEALGLPVGTGGRVHYNDCLFGLTKVHFDLGEDSAAEAARRFLDDVVSYDRTAVFTVHHAQALRRITRLLQRRAALRRAVVASQPLSAICVSEDAIP